MSAPAYELSPHVCAACLGRVLVHKSKGGGAWSYRCSNCGATGDAVGHKPGSICACRSRIGNRDAGIRCVANPRRSVELPFEFVAQEVG